MTSLRVQTLPPKNIDLEHEIMLLNNIGDSLVQIAIFFLRIKLIADKLTNEPVILFKKWFTETDGVTELKLVLGYLKGHLLFSLLLSRVNSFPFGLDVEHAAVELSCL